MNKNLTRILSHWGLQDCETKEIYATAWQAGEEYVLKEYQDLNLLERNLKILNILDEMNGWVKKNFEKSGWNRLPCEEYEEVVSKLAGIYSELPVQLIHRDVHFGNFLFADGSFSGYIDFDLSQRNIRIFDICYFLLGLRSKEEEIQLTDEQWFTFLECVFRGYETVLKLSETEKRAVPYVMECIELLFVSYFEGENDLECADNAYEIYQFIREHEDGK